MSRIDAIKETNAWSRLFIGIFIAIDVTLIGWIAQQYEPTLECLTSQHCASEDTSVWLVLAALGLVIYISSLLMYLNWKLFHRIRELENLE